MRTCAHWLNWKCGIGLVAAREKLRVAHALEHLPLNSQAMRCGALSYAKVRAMTRVATPENEEFLLTIAHNGTASHVETVVQHYRRTQRLEELEHDGARQVMGACSEPRWGALVEQRLEFGVSLPLVGAFARERDAAGFGERQQGAFDPLVQGGRCRPRPSGWFGPPAKKYAQRCWLLAWLNRLGSSTRMNSSSVSVRRMAPSALMPASSQPSAPSPRIDLRGSAAHTNRSP